MRYPYDFYADDIRIDVDEIANYVADNWEYFKNRCDPNGSDKTNLREIVNAMDAVLCDNDYNRRLRDSSHEYDTDRGVILYNEYLKIRDELAKMSY